ncbi:hypothetical protein [Tunturiibacter gelidiferens]|uniref:Uncharacterized protein n=1 Tax=Tunturiibacter gelidiferens TaxID=3069689 RepID=A0AAU7YVV3_9BACT
MKLTLTQILNEKNPNTDSVLHAARYFVAEKFGDVPPSGMRETLLESWITAA